MSTLIKTQAVKALLRFAAVKDNRFYLVGVFFDPQGYAVATDGHAMLCVRIPSFTHATGFIIPSATLKAALGLNKKIFEIAVTENLCGGITYTPIDGRFPDWRRVTPTAADGTVVTFDPDLLARVKAAAMDLGYREVAASCLPINYNGHGANVITLEEASAIAVVMPTRADAASMSYVSAFLSNVTESQS
jgi:DNA polymerase III subunit beta